jgi:hypothetical protein
LIASERSSDAAGAVFVLDLPLLLGFVTTVAAVYSRRHPFGGISRRERSGTTVFDDG